MVRTELTSTTQDGLKLYGCEWRPDSTPAKGLIVLVHGIGEHIGRYEHVAEAMTQAGFVLAGYDLRGHGRSQGQRGHTPSYDTFLDEIGQSIEENHKRFPDLPCFLYGHSMGGALVLNFGLRRPSVIKGVIATGPMLRTAFAPPAFKVMLGRMMDRMFPAFSMTNGLEAGTLYHSSGEDKKYETDPLVHGLLSARLGIAMIDNGLWALNHAAEFPLPLLLMHGGDDRITDPKASREFADKVGNNCTLKIWNGLYHEIHNEQEQNEVFNFMVTWMNSLL